MVIFRFLRNMSVKISANIFANAETAEKRLKDLKTKLEGLRQIKIEEKIKVLSQENTNLAIKVNQAKNELIKLETSHGKKQYSVPGKSTDTCNIVLTNTTETVEKTLPPSKVKKDKEPVKKTKEKSSPAASDDIIIDVRKLDFRIGKIVEINKHPDADSLYVEKIDCGEERTLTVVSGLVNHVPIEDMRDKIVMILCNLKPVKMRGVTSEAMVMCASSADKVEVLIPPSEAIPGDLVCCEGYPREPEAQLNPKKKIFETCAPDLKTNDDKVACYKGNPLIVPGKGYIIAPTLKGVNVK